ncbi:MAG TPA: hypothetical protein VF334_17780, partial [Polyangia bacterium]
GNTIFAQKISQVEGVGQVFVGGLLLSQVLTLYTTPVIYLYMEKLARLWSGKHPKPSEDEPVTEPAP